ncbi:YlbF family regulator [Candidatus Xianfuyuplasma coldseepsis]|uniref:YlbF family regulator n=1 Tax=Candidatus Xianfuyuplasma coldseepsis TaxID=2782163 RepID=A0A7L7KU42_9MOLU|nr:YlbF family regulator [Xianfuyuplasma coldseepsis]QMS85524.1 hypothetical protein G4Z02_07140 [Xianfuyuplasma coldseepsis]
MEQQIIENVYELIDELKQSLRYKRLLVLKQQIEESSVIQEKVAAFQQWNDAYNDVKKYGQYHPDLQHTRTQFRKVKQALYEDSIVAEYKRLEQEIQQRLDSISAQIAQAISTKIKHPNELGILNRH